MVRMGITLDRGNGTYKVHDLFGEHNHILQTAQTSHLMPSQRNISKHQAIDIDVAHDSGIAPKLAHEFLGRYAKMIVDYAHFGDVITFDTTLEPTKKIGHLVCL